MDILMATALLVAGTALTATNSVMEGIQARAVGKAKKNIADYNADLLDRQARSRTEESRFEEARMARQARMALGTQIARGGKSGASTSAEALADTAFQFAMDRNLILRRGLLESENMRQQGQMQRALGKYYAATGKHQSIGKFMEAGGSILSGAYSLNKMGAFGGTGSGFTADQQSAFFSTGRVPGFN